MKKKTGRPKIFDKRRQLTIHLDMYVYDYVINRAKNEHRSMNNMLTVLLEQKCIQDVKEAGEYLEIQFNEKE